MRNVPNKFVQMCMMEKTVIVLAANSLSTTPCGDTINIDVNLPKANKACTETFSLCKTFWSCSTESVSDYCRVILDLFPSQYQVCVIASDAAKCLAVNTWRDEDQELDKILAGLQNFGMPQFVGAPAQRHYLESVQKGITYAVRCLVDLTATQYAMVTAQQKELPSNKGRVILLAALKNCSDISKLEAVFLETMKTENMNIHQSRTATQDVVYRLPIAHCELVVINMYAPTLRPHPITDSPITVLSPEVTRVVYSFPAKLLKEKLVSLAKAHFNLATTVITGIPMKEEQVGGSSANYDVELLHHADMHRDILRAGFQSATATAPVALNSVVSLKWATPRSSSLDMQLCTSAFRVTPVDVMARPTVCLVNFVLSGKSVLLEQAKQTLGKLVSHILTSHSGAIFLQSIPTNRSLHDDVPSISEGWGGKVSDYRIMDFGQFMLTHKLYPHHINRTVIPSQLPIETAINSIKRQTQFWPITFGETLLFSLQEELQPIVTAYRHDYLTEDEFDKCQKVILRLQSKEANNESLFTAVNTRSKGARREEHYTQLWTELQSFLQAYSRNSERHWKLFELLQTVMSSSPSCAAHKPPPKPEAKPSLLPTAEPKNVTKLAWSELDRYQSMTVREKKDMTTEHTRGVGWGGTRHDNITTQSSTGEMSFLALWNLQADTAASKKHDEFAGRLKYGNKAELYQKSQQTSAVPMNTD